jgi:DNA-binding transcriptional ArsR family regulator
MTTERVIHAVSELKAVTHPLRVQMLAALRADGPATSAELARRFKTDTGSTSYHLRQLKRYGFVEPAEQRDGRERRWAAAQQTTSWDGGELAQTEEGRFVVAVMRLRQLEALGRVAEDYERFSQARRDWDAAAGLSDYLVRLTPASLTVLWERFADSLDELAAADADDPEARQVSVFAGGFPTADS